MALDTDDPEARAREVQRAVLERTDLWCSVGMGDSKHRAKLASAFAKPRGVFRLTRAEWPALMGPRPVEALWGIGKKTAAKLVELGIHTVDELARADDEVLAGRFGPNTGPWIRSLGTGEDDGEVTAEPYVRRGQSHERTFQRDLTDHDEIRHETERIARELFADLPEDRPVMRVTVKLRTCRSSRRPTAGSCPNQPEMSPRSSRPRSRPLADSSSIARCACSASAPSSPNPSEIPDTATAGGEGCLRPSGWLLRRARSRSVVISITSRAAAPRR